MMGSEAEHGVIPRLCQTLFDRISALTSATVSFKVEASYMEIYNEKVAQQCVACMHHSPRCLI